ncbi:YlbF family regulator [Enterococcus casseliflavus]|uniref:YlbF family regulator n=1 Tax=Enterococcus casseliflavus TaxID=37734 RepID=UPI0035E0B1E4
MIYDEAFFEIEDQIDSLVTAIKASETCRNYQIAKQTMHQDPVAQELMRTFLEKKLDFERIEAYGAYAPDFKEKKRAMRTAKRQLDLNEQVSEYRWSETQLQRLLDELTVAISTCFSPTVKVDAGSPFFQSKSSCGGNCDARG